MVVTVDSMRTVEPPTSAICAFTSRTASSMAARLPLKPATWIFTMGDAHAAALHDGSLLGRLGIVPDLNVGL